MEPRPPATLASEREKELQRDLQHAYETLTEVTSRLLLVNEASEAALAGTDRNDICDKFLVTAARGVSARCAALLLLEGGGLAVGAAYGIAEDQADALSEDDGVIQACETAIAGQTAHVVDATMVDEEVRQALALEAGRADQSAAGSGDGEETDAGDEDEEVEEGEDEEEEEEEEADEEGEPGAGAREALGVYLPIHLEGETLGVLALGDRLGGRAYRNDELVFLQHLLRQFALTLHRSTLIEQNQQRLEELNALLRVSREITSTLDLDAVLRSVVNTVTAVTENDRAEIALLRGGRLVVRSVSGLTRLDADQVELFKLGAPLEYLRLHPQRIQISANDLSVDPPPAGHAVFGEYFSAQEMRSFMALPLKDDQGLLGFLCLESRQDAWAMEAAEGDTLSILAAQTTVAIRNATLYSEIPLRGMSQPVSQFRQRVESLSYRGRIIAAAVVLAVLAGLILPIYPERGGGAALVRPWRYQGARAMTEGVVTQTLIRGGEEVRAGQQLAVLADLDLSGRISTMRGQIEGARRDVAIARRAADVSSWRAGEIRLAALERSLALEERRASASVLTAPLSGQVLEMDLAQRKGQHLGVGESFCTVAALQQMAVEFGVGETQIGRVQVGQPVAVKVMSFPTRVYQGRVVEVGWEGRAQVSGGTRFMVRALIDNPDRSLRPGMTGVAKASLGPRAAGALLFGPLLRGIQMMWP